MIFKKFKFRTETIYIATVLFVGLFLRFYKIKNIATFGHDNSRDLILLYKLYVYNEVIYRGPVFSIIWAHLSFIYYYLLYPFVYIQNFNPLSVPVITSSINLVALLLLMITVLKLFNKFAAIIAGIIYSVSFLVIKEAAFGLNPSFVPPFTICFYFSVYKILNGDNKYLNLLAFSLFGLFSFHPSGIFIIPILGLLYIMFRPKIKLKELTIPILIFTTTTIIPYLVQEKKFNFYDIKQVINFIAQQHSASDHLSMSTYLLNFLIVLVKNISMTLFAYDNAAVCVLSIILLLTIFCYALININKKIKPENLLAILIMLYILPLGFFIKFYDTGPRSGWFQPVAIPLIVIFVGFLLEKIYKTKFKKVTLFIIFIMVVCNISLFATFSFAEDSYTRVKNISSIIELDSDQRIFDIIGIKPQAYFYMLWFYSLNKDKYYAQIKWDKSLNAPLKYYIEQKEKLDETKIRIYLTENKLSKSTKIYNDEYGSVYRFE